jgi:superkiller protein 3
MYTEAESILEGMTKADKRDPEANKLLALIYADTARVDQAITTLQVVVEQLPQDAAAHNNLGFLLFANKRADEAVGVLQKAVQLDSNNALYRRNLGYALVAQGVPQRALQVFRTLGPPAEAHYQLGVALEMRGETIAAGDAYRIALQENPGHLRAFEALTRLQSPQEAMP